MIRLHYSCTLLTDLVLSAVAATEGFHKSLDYIPGAKFLGITASKLYKNEKEKPQRILDLFHNGSTRFGDAHPYIDGQRLHKIPASWQFQKGEDSKGLYYLHHNLSQQDKRKLIASDIQLKQAKERYISWKEDDVLESYAFNQQFSIKSAYDIEKRKSKDSQMYGYFGLEKGTVWSFYLDLDNKDYEEDINTALVGKRRIGRSKSAEYGLVEIKRLDDLVIKHTNVSAGEICLYAQSNLCFYDEFGNSTLRPAAKQLGLPDSTILWQKSQIRSRSYRTWNQKRQSRDADRIIIEKGSVFVIKTTKNIHTSIFEKGIGLHRAEGFGQVLVNPKFLESDFMQPTQLNYRVEKKSTSDVPKVEKTYAVESGENDAIIREFLKQRKKEKQDSFDVLKKVNEFIAANADKYSGIKNSQWGQIRRLTKIATDTRNLHELVFKEGVGFLDRGQTQNVWRKKERREYLEKYLFGKPALKGKKEVAPEIPEPSVLDFTMKLAAEMAKIKKHGTEDSN